MQYKFIDPLFTIVLTFFGSVLQVLANRPDIIREDYMNELCILQDDVPPFPNQVSCYSRKYLQIVLLDCTVCTDENRMINQILFVAEYLVGGFCHN